MKSGFSTTNHHLHTVIPVSYTHLTLAFVGDCIYDLVIRTIVVERGNTASINGTIDTRKMIKYFFNMCLVQFFYFLIIPSFPDILSQVLLS